MWQRLYTRWQGTLQNYAYTLNWAIYMLILVLTTVYVYARLDYVRSGPRPPPNHHLNP